MNTGRPVALPDFDPERPNDAVRCAALVIGD